MKYAILPTIWLLLASAFMPSPWVNDAQAATSNVIGHVDGVYVDSFQRAVYLTGWLFDNSDYDRDMSVLICEGGSCAYATADAQRPDVDARYGRTRTEEHMEGGRGIIGHGFIYPLPGYWLDGQPHELNVYAEEEDGGEGTLLPGSPITLTDTENFDLKGRIDAIEIDETCTAHVQGWAVNYTSESTAVPIIISTEPIPTVYGPFVTTLADLYRPDLTLIGTDGRHGFNEKIQLPLVGPDCLGLTMLGVYAVDVNDGRIKELGGQRYFTEDIGALGWGDLVKSTESPTTFKYLPDETGSYLEWYPTEASFLREAVDEYARRLTITDPMEIQAVIDELTVQARSLLTSPHIVPFRQLQVAPVKWIAPESVRYPCDHCSATSESATVTYNLFKRPDNPEIFYVEEQADGSLLLRWLADDASKVKLYGDDWQSHVVEIPDWIKVQFPVGERITESDIECNDAECDVVN